MNANPQHNHEYLPMEGLKTFTDAVVKLVLGANSPVIKENRVNFNHNTNQ